MTIFQSKLKRMATWLSFVISTVLFSAANANGGKMEWEDRILYFALIDRFENGDVSNDALHGDANCIDESDIHAYQGGDLAGLSQRLNHIDDLGASAIWITPLYKGVAAKQGENCGFPGYWANFKVPYELELDERFGSAAEFDSLIEKVHSLDMKIMLDMVVNHAGYNAELVNQRPEWFHPEFGCEHLGNPEIVCPLAGLPDFNHKNNDAAAYLIDVHQRWARRFNIDAIRMDTVKHVVPWYFAEWNAAMDSVRPGLFKIGELLDESSFRLFGRYLKSGFDGLFNFPLRRALIQTFAQGGSVDSVARRVKETLALAGQKEQGKWSICSTIMMFLGLLNRFQSS